MCIRDSLKGKRTSFYGESARSSYYLSNLSYKVDARLQIFRAFLPLGRADFSIVCGNNIGRNADELLRKVEAAQFVATHLSLIHI